MKFLDAVRIAIQSFLSLPLFGDRLWVTSSWFKGALDEDWEVEEKKVSLTEAEFEAAVNRTTKSFSMYNPPSVSEYLSQLKKELGL